MNIKINEENRQSWKSCYHNVTIFTTNLFIVMIMVMMYYDVMYKFHLQTTIVTTITHSLSNGSALFKKIASAATGSKSIRSI